MYVYSYEKEELIPTSRRANKGANQTSNMKLTPVKCT